ncbi:hypothetical protein ADU37_CDS22780 [Thermococcus sp. 2319x1]|uniref:DUF4855 domain-containing protein n=1 Tax=Thermococcus sp. 2319x1 TaxID=1674923 RepID=UPI00073A62AB|nr:DUF4855 domain-containing protein [Thermococcus sp. 2319x1]ALV63975.1 hypothetical protein ADU37_CDS22780 [Thermococcus sp. 2319x1]
MATFGLWYFKWNGQFHESLLSYDDQNATESDFRNRGFDYAVIVGLAGKDIQYTGDGRLDGETFAEDVFRIVSSIPVYITIPYYQYKSSEPREDPIGGNKYWLEWVDGVLRFAGSNLKGFYWSLESAWMFVNYYKDVLCNQGEMPYINPQTIELLTDKIHSHGLKFIWIPTAHTLSLEYTDIWPRNHDVCGYSNYSLPGGSEFFDYVFVQSNYYQRNEFSLKDWANKLESLNNEHNAYNVFMELECDNAVITNSIYRERACEYVKYAKKYPHRAYYFGTDLKAIDFMNEYCLNTLGERYV